MELIPTEEQEAIIAKANSRSNLQIVAYAGTGKTATLKMLAKEMEGPKLYVAFNKRIIEEALEDFPAEAKTLNSVGWKSCRQSLATKCTIEGKKNQILFKQIANDLRGEDRTDAWELYGEILDAVSLAKAAGYVPKAARGRTRPLVEDEFWSTIPAPSILQREIVDQILVHSLKLCYAGVFDFDDQLYFPIVCGGSFSRFPIVFVDERQDLNAVNAKMVEKLTRGGRLISVGDPFQSIYGFRGAVQNGMEVERTKHEMDVATLSISFRCKSEIVRNARWRVPEFKWNALGGRVIRREHLGYEQIPLHSAIICRNNAPLFRLALNLLSNDRPCRVAGSDIGPKLIGALKRLSRDPNAKQAAMLDGIEKYLEKRKESKTAGDFADCMRVFVSASNSLAEAVARAGYVLRQDGPIYLLTGHKAKGLEWDTVFHLDPWLIKDDDEQEMNLRYVIQTRARDEYNEIDSRNIG